MGYSHSVVLGPYLSIPKHDNNFKQDKISYMACNHCNKRLKTIYCPSCGNKSSLVEDVIDGFHTFNFTQFCIDKLIGEDLFTCVLEDDNFFHIIANSFRLGFTVNFSTEKAISLLDINPLDERDEVFSHENWQNLISALNSENLVFIRNYGIISYYD